MNRNRQEKGITLIALVVTVIILLILAAITVNLIIGENGIISKAKEAGKNYVDSANKEVISLEELTNTTEDIIKRLEGTGLGFEKQGYCSEQFTDYIHISAVASNHYKDNLTYTLYWGTDESYKNEEGIENKQTKVAISGTEVRFEQIDLINDTIYYWRVDVTDGIETIKGIEGQTRTYCQTRKCEGPFTTMEDCTNCTNGIIKQKGYHTWKMTAKYVGKPDYAICAYHRDVAGRKGVTCGWERSGTCSRCRI